MKSKNNRKEIFNNHIKEITTIINLIERSSSEIQEDRIILALEDFPFKEGLQGEIEITDSWRKGISKSVFIPAYDMLLSLISLEDTNNKKKHHLLSFDPKRKQWYVNFRILSAMEFNEHYREKLVTANSKNWNLFVILLNLYMGLRTNNDINSDAEAERFRSSGIIGKAKLLKDRLKARYSERKIVYRPLEDYMLFYTTEYSLFVQAKQDIIELSQVGSTAPALNQFIDIFRENGKLVDSPLSINMDGTDNRLQLLGSSGKLPTLSQAKALTGITRELNQTVGIAGAGKTHISSIASRQILLAHAISLASTSEPMSMLYCSYTQAGNDTFFSILNKSTDQKIKKLVLTTGQSEILKNAIREKKQIISGEKSAVDIDRFNSITQKLQKHPSVSAIKEWRNSMIAYQGGKKVPNESEKTELRKLAKSMFAWAKKEENKSFFSSLFGKKNEGFVIKDKIIKQLSEVITLPAIVKISDFKYTIKEIEDTIKRRDVIAAPSQNKLEIGSLVDGISEEDLYWYLDTYPLFQDVDNKNLFISVLNWLEATLMATTQDEIDSIKERILIKTSKGSFSRAISTLFPISISLITDLRKYYSIDHRFSLSVIDESLLTPPYLIYPILARSDSASMLGDIGQMNFSHLFPFVVAKDNILSLYDNNIEHYNKEGLLLSNRSDNRVNSLFELVLQKTNQEDRLSILIDNFRSPPHLIRAQVALSPSYYDYVRRYWQKEDENTILKGEDDVLSLIRVFRTGKRVFTLMDNSRESENPLMFYDTKGSYQNDREKIYRRLLAFVGVQHSIPSKRVMIISLFKGVIPEIRKIINDIREDYLQIDSIFVGAVEDVQGLERDIVIFDSSIEEASDEQLAYLVAQPQALSMSIGRTKELFVFIGNFKVLKNTSTATSLGRFMEHDLFEIINPPKR